MYCLIAVVSLKYLNIDELDMVIVIIIYVFVAGIEQEIQLGYNVEYA
jgi:hypothetical protein